jgi:glycosyltransferase involved in cell wall biosynthesis
LGEDLNAAGIAVEAGPTPLVSVLLPVRDGGAFLAEAVRSVLDQGLRNLELVAVDDGSTDGSGALLRAEARRDGRVRVLEGPGQGLVQALNLGLAACRGPYIARMDADDRCRRGRLERQVRFLEGHPGTGVVGGQVRRFGAAGARRYRYPMSHAAIQAAAVFECPLAHPTVLFRASLLPVGAAAYDPAERHAEDYGLWTRWLGAGVGFAALPEAVLDYRVHPAQVGSALRPEQGDTADRIRLSWLRRLGLDPGPKELELHRAAGQGRWVRGLDVLCVLEAWLLKLRRAAKTAPWLDAAAFDAVLAERWTSALWANRGLGAPLLRLALESPLGRLRHPRPWMPWAAGLGSFLPAGGQGA